MESEKRIETYERTSQLSVICSHRSFPHQLFAIPYSLFATPHSPLATYPASPRKALSFRAGMDSGEGLLYSFRAGMDSGEGLLYSFGR